MPVLRRLLALTILLATISHSSRAETIEWIRQIGTWQWDDSHAVSTDGLGNIFIAGYTGANLGGPNAGLYDAYVSKFSDVGSLIWTRRFGTHDLDFARSVAVDSLGSVYVSGGTDGNLAASNAGNMDAFVRKYDSNGTVVWTRQIGTPGDDLGRGSVLDRLGNIYIVGDTHGSLGGAKISNPDAFIFKLDSSGNTLWTRQFGTDNGAVANGIATDGHGNIYVAGGAGDGLGGIYSGAGGPFVAKYNELGDLLWARQIVTTDAAECESVSADNLGNVYITGGIEGSFVGSNAGDYDVYTTKFDADGHFLWTRQLGTSGKDISHAIHADNFGNVYVGGEIAGGIGGSRSDAFLCKYDHAGNLFWLHQLGQPTTNVTYGVTSDGNGNIYFSGSTQGSIGGPKAGAEDAFLVKISDPVVPEPSTVALGLIALLGAAFMRSSLR